MNNVLYSNKIYNYIASPEKLAQDLSASMSCRTVLQNLNFQSWIHDYISYLIPDSEIAKKNKECILYSFLYIINELTPIDEEKFNQWKNNPNAILEEVIALGTEKDWVLDKHSALALCSKIIIDYTLNYIQTVDKDSNIDVLRQIISNYPQSAINDIYDPIWEIIYYDILDKYDCVDDNDLPINLNNIEELVNKRILVPNYYNNL